MTTPRFLFNFSALLIVFEKTIYRTAQTEIEKERSDVKECVVFQDELKRLILFKKMAVFFLVVVCLDSSLDFPYL